MKPQSLQGALTTESVRLSIDDYITDDDAKLSPRDCLMIAGQIATVLSACGLLHWLLS
jgi:hypothetical protein